jgi:hypothetical protein
MYKFVISFAFVSLLLISCSQNEKIKVANNLEYSIVDTTDLITPKDTKSQIRAKLKLGAEYDEKEFGEITLYDDYFNNQITKYYMKDDNGDRFLTAVVYQDRLRYMKLLIQHVDDTSAKNKHKYYQRIRAGLDKAIKSGECEIVDKTYLKFNEKGDIWYNAFIVSESKKTGKQNYWNLMAPEADFDYLKYMVNAFQILDGFDTEFVIEK